MIKNIALTADSGVLKKINNITIVPSCVRDKDGRNYLDQKTITNKEIFERRDNGEKFKTASPSIGSFIETFEDLLIDYDEIIHLSMSGDISSGSLNAAHTVSRMFEPGRVHIVDTRQGGPGGGLVAEFACKLLQDGFSSQEIIGLLTKEIIPNVKTTFLVPNPIGFLESGRNKTNVKIAAHWKEVIVRMLMRKGRQFEVAIKDGKLLQQCMHRFPKENMYLDFIDNNLSKDEIEYGLISFGGTLLNEEKAKEIKCHIKSKKTECEVVQHDMGGVISAYACKDTVGISYVKKK